MFQRLVAGCFGPGKPFTGAKAGGFIPGKQFTAAKAARSKALNKIPGRQQAALGFRDRPTP